MLLLPKLLKSSYSVLTKHYYHLSPCLRNNSPSLNHHMQNAHEVYFTYRGFLLDSCSQSFNHLGGVGFSFEASLNPNILTLKSGTGENIHQRTCNTNACSHTHTVPPPPEPSEGKEWMFSVCYLVFSILWR